MNEKDAQMEYIFQLYHQYGFSQYKIADITGIPRTTIGRWLRDERNIALYNKYVLVTDNTYINENDEELSNNDIITENIKLSKRVQRLQDANRVERKTFRETARIDNTLEILNTALLEVLKENKLTEFNVAEIPDLGKECGVIQLSDIHFNELVSDIDGNSFDFDIASKRLQKFVDRAKKYFNSFGITNVAVFMTGDLLNSDRRLDEITSAATNRSQAIFLAVDILQQLLLDLADDYNVTVASVTGNESRVGEHVQWSNFLASDSYDIVIHNFLTYLLSEHPNITFLSIEDSLEAVVDVNGINFLLVHGHGHKGLASDRQIEQQTDIIRGKYARRGVKIDYVICGHIHSCRISDKFARSSGLVGNNSYAEKALNLSGKSSQNAYIVSKDGSIDGIKVCLQSYDGYEGYNFNKKLQAYHNTSTSKNSTVVIQSVII